MTSPSARTDIYWLLLVRPGIGWQGCGTATGPRVRSRAYTLSMKWEDGRPAPGPDTPLFPLERRPGDRIVIQTSTYITVGSVLVPTVDTIKNTVVTDVLRRGRWYSFAQIQRRLRDHLTPVTSTELLAALNQLQVQRRVESRVVTTTDDAPSYTEYRLPPVHLVAPGPGLPPAA